MDTMIDELAEKEKKEKKSLEPKNEARKIEVAHQEADAAFAPGSAPSKPSST